MGQKDSVGRDPLWSLKTVKTSANCTDGLPILVSGEEDEEQSIDGAVGIRG